MSLSKDLKYLPFKVFFLKIKNFTSQKQLSHSQEYIESRSLGSRGFKNLEFYKTGNFI